MTLRGVEGVMPSEKYTEVDDAIEAVASVVHVLN